MRAATFLVEFFWRAAVLKSFINGDHATDLPTTLKAAAFDVLAEASAARNDLHGAAARIAADARVGRTSLQVHAKRAAAIGGGAASDALETGLRAGSRAWRDAQRQATAWGSSALDRARSQPAAVLVGVAIVGVAIGFWLNSASRRATASVKNRARVARTTKHDGA